MVKNWLVVLLAALVSAVQPASAATWYVAPIGAVLVGTPDGSVERPWASTDDALASGNIVGGDSVLLMDGVHATLKVQQSFAAPVTFQSQNGRRARVESVYLLGAARNIIVQNLKVWPSNPLLHGSWSYLLRSAPSTSDNLFVNLDVRSGLDAYNYPNWSAAEWLARAQSGAAMEGTRLRIRQSNFTGIYFGIVLSGVDGIAVGNTIDGFAADGMRGVGARGVFRDNVVQNCVQIDDNHADGFQSFSKSSVVGLVLERNIFTEWNLTPAAHPLRCSLQGIGMFDGFFDNLTIINNVVDVRHWHGITVMGARGARIINNTVVNIDGLEAKAPWIAVYPTKAGVPSTDVIVANNLAMSFGGGTDKANRVRFTSNRVVRSVPYSFPGWLTFNYAPRPGGRFIDAADPLYAPELDVLRHRRPLGGGADLGAYEVSSLGLPEQLSDEVLSPPLPVSAARDLAELVPEP